MDRAGSRRVLSRRKFVAAIGVFAVVGGLAAGGWFFLRREILYWQLRKKLNYLNLDRDVLRQFAEDHAKYGDLVVYTQIPVHMRFLLSTDFFRYGADETRSLEYLAYYDPYISPCYNPTIRR